jgi:hypothetical protein
MDPAGRPGRYTYARVRNLNSHGVVFVADFTLAERSYLDQEIVVEQQRLTLEAAGTPAAAAVVQLHGRGGIAEASVYGIEKF